MNHGKYALLWANGATFEEIFNQHAHDLAEKIRNSEQLRSYTDDHMRDCNEAADLIDPEA